MAINNSFLSFLNKTQEGQDFIEFLKREILSLDTLTGIDFTDKEKAAIEGKARELARDKLVGILTPLVNAKDVNIIKDARDDFNVDVPN